jgi:hypothetical protein
MAAPASSGTRSAAKGSEGGQAPKPAPRALLWAGSVLAAAGAAATVFALVSSRPRRRAGEPERAERAGDVPPVAPLPPPLPLTTPRPGELRGVQARFFKWTAAPGEAALELPDPSRVQVLVEVYDAAGALVPPGERQLLWGGAAQEEEEGEEEEEEGGGAGRSVPWIACDLRRERSATRVIFSGLDPRISRSSARSCLQILDSNMRPLCAVRFGAESQRVVFDLEAPAAAACHEAIRRRQETPLSELLADDPAAQRRVFGASFAFGSEGHT